MPSEVESPMWTAARQEVRSPDAPAETPGEALPDADGPLAGLLAADGLWPARPPRVLLADERPDAVLLADERPDAVLLADERPDAVLLADERPGAGLPAAGPGGEGRVEPAGREAGPR